MSLKAKIEAVIYASEEPVTLAQLMGLLGQEAQAELDQIAEAQQALALGDENEPEGNGQDEADVDGLNEEIVAGADEGPEPAEASQEPAEEAEQPVAAGAEASEETAEVAEVAEQPAETAEAVAEISEPVEAAAAEPMDAAAAGEESAEKKATRESKEEKERTRRLREYFRSMLEQLVADYANGDRGLEVREVAGGYRLATKPEYHDAVRGFVKSLKPPLKLSLQALETLAVVAYKQPVTAPEVAEIRGVDSGGVLGSLMTRKLITTAGRKQVIGRPILYKTTKDFLLRFGLRDINELPSIEEFEKMAGELAEQEEIPMEPEAREHHAPESPEELEPERHTHLPQADGSPDPVDDPLDDELPEDASEEDLVEETVAAEPEEATAEPEEMPVAEEASEPEAESEGEEELEAEEAPKE
jgi:segregation and condensation protein B